MDLRSTLKSLRDGVANTLGKNLGTMLWGLFAVGGPVVTWLTVPTVYPFQLTRMQAAVGLLVLGATLLRLSCVVHSSLDFSRL